MRRPESTDYNGYLRIRCYSCGNTFAAYYRGDIYGEQIRTCPYCLEKIDREIWEDDILPAWAGLLDSNHELRKHAQETKSSQFDITFITPTSERTV